MVKPSAPKNDEEDDKEDNDVGTLLLTGEIEPGIASKIVKALMTIEAMNREANDYQPINLIINTPGGDLYSTWMICDVISMMKTPVHTLALGQVASGGFLIFMHGAVRISTVNTQFMSHRFSMVNESSHSDMIAQRKEIDRIHQRIVDHYCRCSGLSEKEVEKHLLAEHDVWLSAEDCKKFNLCDVILKIPPRKPIKAKKKKNKDGK